MSSTPPAAWTPSSATAVLFDLDGTLVDASPDLAASLRHVMAGAPGEPLALSEVRPMIGDGPAVLVARAFAARGLPQPPDALARFRAHYEEHCLDATVAYPGVPRLLRDLSAVGRKLAVVTNKPTPFARRVVEGLGLGAVLPLVVGPEDVPARKPAPGHVLATLERLGVGPREAVVVGDGETDVAAGRAAGCLTVAVLWGFRGEDVLRAERPDHVVATPAELARLLLG